MCEKIYLRKYTRKGYHFFNIHIKEERIGGTLVKLTLCTCYTTLRIHIINGLSTVPPLVHYVNKKQNYTSNFEPSQSKAAVELN